MNDDFAVIDPAMLLESFDEPIVIHRSFLPLAGSINAALLLTWMITLTREREDDEGWLTLTQADWSTETGLSRYEQESARKALRMRGLIEERRSGMPMRLQMRVRPQDVAEALRRQGQQRYAAFLAERDRFEAGRFDA